MDVGHDVHYTWNLKTSSVPDSVAISGVASGKFLSLSSDPLVSRVYCHRNHDLYSSGHNKN